MEVIEAAASDTTDGRDVARAVKVYGTATGMEYETKRWIAANEAPTRN